MYDIKVEANFSAAHNLRGYRGKCEELHGHNWKVEIVVSSEKPDKIGMVLDFRYLKMELLRVLGKLDHKYLNKIPYFSATGGKVVRASAEDLPFQDNYFDFVNCAEVSEHADNPAKMLAEIFRVLKSGGKCYISFHNRCGVYDYHYHLYFINWMPRAWTEPILKFLGKQKKDGQAGRQKLISMHYYTCGRILRMLRDAGFSAADIRAERIKKISGVFHILFLFFYFCLLRPFYFNTFHFLLAKP